MPVLMRTLNYRLHLLATVAWPGGLAMLPLLFTATLTAL
jgi:putative copper export protein